MNPVIAIRPFEEHDYAALPALFALLEPHVADADVRARVTRMRQEGWQCLGTYADAEMIAMAGWSERCHLFSGPIIYVENVAVHPQWRAHGLGKALMDAIAQLARDRGCSKITLDAYAINHAAQAFYSKLGYLPTGLHFVLDLS